MEKVFFKGSDVNQITMIRTVKEIIIDLFRGYPAYKYWGIIEGRFEDKQLGEIVRNELEKDGFIEVEKINNGQKNYRLTSRGVDLAVSMIDLDYADKTHISNKRMYFFTKLMLVFTIGMFTIGLAQLFLAYFQNPIF